MVEEKQGPQGFCHFCKSNHDVISVSDEQAKIIAEDAQSNADYYLLVEHKTPAGEKCVEGSGKAPEYLLERDDPDDWPDIPGEFGEKEGGDPFPSEEDFYAD